MGPRPPGGAEATPAPRYVLDDDVCVPQVTRGDSEEPGRHARPDACTDDRDTAYEDLERWTSSRAPELDSTAESKEMDRATGSSREEREFHMNQAEIRDIMSDPVAQRLIQAPIHARIAYTAKDGSPRVVPIGYIWNGNAIVMCSPPIAPKVKALSASPKVALTIDTEDFPPKILLVRGEAALETVDGVPDEFIEAARRFVADERMPQWEAQAHGLYDQMVLIRITPTWAKIIDFDTRLPKYVEQLIQSQESRHVDD
jgi:Pyridoxamine 5'-phosphate oxidase